MQKARIIMRQPWMNDYNELAKIVNEIIEKLEEKKEVVPIQLTKYVKDYNFFKWVETPLPYEAHYTITTEEDFLNLIKKYNLDDRDLNAYKGIIDNWRILSLSITINEDLSEKDLKQEEMFQTVETVNVWELWDLWNLLGKMWVKEISVIEPKENKKTKTKTKAKTKKGSWWWKIKKK